MPNLDLSGAANLSLWISLGAALAIVFVLLGLKALILRVTERSHGTFVWQALLPDLVRKTRLWFLIAVAARLVEPYAPLPDQVREVINFVFVVAATLQCAIWIRAIIVGLVEHRAAGEIGDESNLNSAIGLIRLLVSVAVFAIAAILILDNLGVNVTGLVAGLGIGGIAIGLAAQGIFSDLFAALSIIFDKPFRVGDAISYSGKEGVITGTVERIGLKSTRIRSLTGEMRIIGNAQLLSQEVTNYSGRSFFRLHLPVGVTYQTPARIAELIPAIMQEETERNGYRFVRSNFTGFGASSIDFELYFEADVDSIVDANTAYQRVALAILRVFNERGIEFADPTQTNFFAAPDGTAVTPFPVEAAGAAG